MLLDVTGHGRATRNTTEDGLTAVGAISGTLTATVRWPGPWLTEGDPAELAAQTEKAKALFPGVIFDGITVVPAVR